MIKHLIQRYWNATMSIALFSLAGLIYEQEGAIWQFYTSLVLAIGNGLIAHSRLKRPDNA